MTRILLVGVLLMLFVVVGRYELERRAASSAGPATPYGTNGLVLLAVGAALIAIALIAPIWWRY